MITVLILVFLIVVTGYGSLVAPALDRVALWKSLRGDYLRQMERMPEGSDLRVEMAAKAVEADKKVANAWRQDIDDFMGGVTKKPKSTEVAPFNEQLALDAARVTVIESGLELMQESLRNRLLELDATPDEIDPTLQAVMRSLLDETPVKRRKELR